MIKEIKDYVTFYYPGAFFADNSTVQIDTKDIKKILDLSESKGAYGFAFYAVEYIYHDGKEYRSKVFDKTGIFYIDGKLFTPKQIEREYPNSKILLANMRNNDWKKVVKTNVGWFLPFEKDDSIIYR